MNISNNSNKHKRGILRDFIYKVDGKVDLVPPPTKGCVELVLGYTQGVIGCLAIFYALGARS
jgi:ABC-type cobalt transport system substrate-binding protein